MRKVAESIAYSPTTPYLYFKNKADRLIAVSTEGFSGDRAHRYLRAMAIECIRQSKFRQVDIYTIGQMSWSIMYGVTSLLVANLDFQWVEEDAQIDMPSATTLEGILA